jgi:hypothetical protein
MKGKIERKRAKVKKKEKYVALSKLTRKVHFNPLYV